VVALRGVAASAFFATEIYLPYLLQEHYDVSAWLSGATLTVGALGWSAASELQARLGARLQHVTALRTGALVLVAGVGGELLVTALHLTPLLVGGVWAVAGFGMGLMYPRVSALVLAASGQRDQGRNSAAVSISDAVGGATAISLTGLVFAAVGGASQPASFVAALVVTTSLSAGALLVSRRTA
jgi:MFS family permease